MELDAVGFTDRAESLMREESKRGAGAVEINNWIKEIFGTIDKIAKPYQLEPISFAGDAITYVARGPHHQARTLYVAGKIQEEFAKRKEEGIKISGGLDSGRLVFGLLDLDEQRALPVVLGTPVVNAKRLESVAIPGDILIPPSFRDTLPPESFKVRGENLFLTEYKLNDALVDFLSRSSIQPEAEYKSDFNDLEKLSCILHPFHFYALREEGLSYNLYDGERRRASLVFVRLRDFEPLWQRLEKEMEEGKGPTVLHQIERVLALTNKLARTYHGTLEKLNIDREPKLVVFFQGERHFEDSLRFACASQKSLNEQGMKTSLGVASGRVYRGMTGVVSDLKLRGLPDESKIELSSIGDVPNIAARLAGLAKEGTILADRFTVMDAERLLVERGEDDGEKEIRGRAGKIRVFEIRGVEETGETLEHGAEIKLVGREGEMRILNELLEKTKEGHPQIAVIVAEAGYGKSLLLDHFIKQHYFEAQDVEVFKGRSYNYSENESFRPWRNIVRRLFDLPEGQDSGALLAKLRQELGQLDEGYQKYLEVFAESFQLAPISAPAEQRFAGFNRKAAEIIAARFKSLPGDKPKLLILEDIHWADHPSLELVKEVIRATGEGQKLMLVLVKRPEKDGEGKDPKLDFLQLPKQNKTELSLPPLPKEVWAKFILAHFSIKGLRDLDGYEERGDESWKGNPDSEFYRLLRACQRLRDNTYEFAEGNLYLGRSMLRYLAHYPEIHPYELSPKTGQPYRFLVQKSENEWVLGDDYIETGILEKVRQIEELHAKQFRSLTPKEQQVLKCAAKLGRDFEVGLLGELVGLDKNQLYRVLDKARRFGLVEESLTDRFSFAHIKAWEAIHNITAEVLLEIKGRGIAHSDEELSRMAGELLERRHPERLEDLARLFGGSDDYLKGIHYQLLLGERYFAREDAVHYELAIKTFGDALSIFKRQVADPKKGPLFSEPEQKRLAQDIAESYLKLSRAYVLTGKSADVLETVQEGRKFVKEYRGWLGEGRVNRYLLFLVVEEAVALHWIQDAYQALAAMEENEIAAETAREMLEQKPESETDRQALAAALAGFYGQKGHLKDSCGLFEEALPLHEEAERFARLSGDFRIIDRVVGRKAIALGRSGRPEEALEVFESLLAEERKRGYHTA